MRHRRVGRTAYDPPSEWDVSDEIFIPEFLAAFLLLHRSGLDVNEKDNVLAATRGEFSTRSVGRSLREQWSEYDLAKRDKLKCGTALMAELDRDDELEALLADDLDQEFEHLGQVMMRRRPTWLNRNGLKRPTRPFSNRKPPSRRQGGNNVKFGWVATSFHRSHM